MGKGNKFIGPVVFAIVLSAIAAYIVLPHHDNLTINNGEAVFMNSGETMQLDFTSEKGEKYDAEEIRWSSSDNSIVYASNKGRIKAGAPGSATVTVSVGDGSEATCDVEVTAKAVKINNGKILKKPSGNCIAPVTVTAPEEVNAYVYFKSHSSASQDFAFFVSSGDSASVKAPLGVYDMYYAAGTTWYGRKLMFGAESKFNKADKTIDLVQNGYSIQGQNIYLSRTADGNLPTTEINEKEFPS